MKNLEELKLLLSLNIHEAARAYAAWNELPDQQNWSELAAAEMNVGTMLTRHPELHEFSERVHAALLTE